jgi:hypothetical protein
MSSLINRANDRTIIKRYRTQYSAVRNHGPRLINATADVSWLVPTQRDVGAAEADQCVGLAGLRVAFHNRRKEIP